MRGVEENIGYLTRLATELTHGSLKERAARDGVD